MSSLPGKIVAALLLLLMSFISIVFHAPSDQASAYGGAGAIYPAQVLNGAPSHTNTVLAVTILPPSLQPATSPMSPAQPARARSAFDVRGRPTISAQLIDSVLASYGSPMAGQGAALVRLGRKYGIDPAFCLAFFVHESAAGTKGEAVLTHNLGNIRAVNGEPNLDGYRYYDSWLQGAEDWYKLISKLYVRGWGLTTIAHIIPVYAPVGDNNDTTAYVDDVQQLVSAWRAQSGS